MSSPGPDDTPRSPVDESPSSAGSSRGQPRRAAAPSKAPRTRRVSRSLIETSGPSPEADLAAIKLTVGVIGGTHGVHGELKLKLLTDHPEQLPHISSVYLGESDVATKVVGFRFQGNQGLIALDGITNPEDGKRLGGLKVRILGSDAVPLEEGEYFIFQLIGLQAEDQNGRHLGTVTDILETGAHDVLVVQPEEGAEMLVPNHPAYVLEIAPSEGRIVITPPVYHGG